MRIRRRRELPFDRVELPGTDPDPEEILAQHAVRECVWRALDVLPADERLTLILRYFTRCESYEAIARLTAVPTGTVRSRLHRPGRAWPARWKPRPPHRQPAPWSRRRGASSGKTSTGPSTSIPHHAPIATCTRRTWTSVTAADAGSGSGTGRRTNARRSSSVCGSRS